MNWAYQIKTYFRHNLLIGYLDTTRYCSDLFSCNQTAYYRYL